MNFVSHEIQISKSGAQSILGECGPLRLGSSFDRVSIVGRSRDRLTLGCGGPVVAIGLGEFSIEVQKLFSNNLLIAW